jgi:hypothetical protein
MPGVFCASCIVRNWRKESEMAGGMERMTLLARKRLATSESRSLSHPSPGADESIFPKSKERIAAA